MNNKRVVNFLVVFFSLFFSFFLSPISIQAATYYVDVTGGNNSNNGTDTATPWQTVSKVNTFTFASGDSVLFKRGETWTFSSSNDRLVGQSGVTYDAYGTGAA